MTAVMSDSLDLRAGPGADTSPPNPAPFAGMAEVTPGEMTEKSRILIVDDDERNLLSLQMILEDLNEELVVARSGEEALRYLLHNDCALILMDVLMPGMDGYETAGLIRSRERSRHIPVIFLTAASKDEVHEFKGYTAGAVDYVFKPIEPFILRSKVSVFVDLDKKTREIRRSAEQERRLLQDNLRANAERLLAEKALQKAEERQALILRSLPIALYSMDAGQPLESPLRIGETVRDITGFPASQFLEPGFWLSRIHPDDLAQVQVEFDRLRDIDASVIEYRWLCADGSHRYILSYAAYVPESHDTPAEIVGSWLDVTERRIMEQQLIHGQKMDSLGRLTGGIAHDFNNMLTVVISSLDRLKRSAAPDSPSLRNINLALNGALRCADLTKRLLSFARHQILNPRSINLNEMISNAEAILRRLIGESIFLEVITQRSLWHVNADSAQMESALINLVVNSRDAMRDGGRLTIETRNITLTQNAGVNIPDGEYVSLSVTDTGVGIPPAHIDKVFEPFFTAKEDGKGTGLGLSIIYSFVRQSGGYIRLDSEVGEGTRIEILLPRLAQPAVSLNPIEVEPDLPKARPGEKILVVEDDSEVRAIVVAFLQELGYAILEAANGDEAISTLAKTSDITLAFSDIAMPGSLNGYQLAAQIAALHPAVPVLLTSANSNGVRAGTERAGEWKFLQKPYRNAELATAIRAAIGDY